MTKRISINVNSAYEAAKYDFENNKASKKESFEKVLDRINKSVYNIYHKAMKEWEIQYEGTGSWLVFFLPEDDSYGTITVVIEPDINSQTFFVDCKDYLNQI